MSEALPLTQRIGQAERALQSVLNRIISQTGITFVHWATLTMIARSGETAQRELLVKEVSNALKCDASMVLGALEALTSQGLVTASPDNSTNILFTKDGDVQFHQLRQRIGQVTERLSNGLSESDLAATHRVLSTITKRANEELSSQ